MAERKKIVLEESCLPSMKSGDYQITAHVKGEKLGSSSSVTETFRVEGPRFRLNAEDIVSVYPADGMRGGFQLQLPHIILKRKTLPWERSMKQQTVYKCASQDMDVPTKEVPWLFLLLLRGNEIVDIKYDKIANITGTEKETGDKGIFFPELYLKEEEKTVECAYIDLPAERFRSILPTERELALLAHARNVEEDDGQNSMEYLDGWVSAVVGNRLPLSGTEGEENRAYLVSLEGYEGWEQAAGKECRSVRLVVLKSWNFYSITDKLHFLEICHELNADRMRIRPEKTETGIEKLQDNGYVPMAHRLRQGSQTISFYRGPLAPVKTGAQELQENSWCSDGFYRYDPEMGVFDVSYAAAWQLGRLLALGNAPAAQEVKRLRSNFKKRMQKERENGILLGKNIEGRTSENTIGKWVLDQLREKRGDIL